MEILRLPEKIPCDKRIHFIVGSVFTLFIGIIFILFSSIFSSTFNLSFLTEIIIISILSGLFAYGIEISQKVFKWGTYDLIDAIATFSGSFIVILSFLVGHLG